MGKFQKFIEKKDDAPLGGTKVKKPPIEIVPDYPGKSPDKPPQGKNAKPYKQGKDCKCMTMKGEIEGTPFSQAGDKGNVYNPGDTKICPVKGKVVDSWPKTSDAPKPKKTKTEAFIEKTKKMSLSEFNKFMKGQFNVQQNLPHVTASEKGRIYPDPIEAVRYAVAVAKASPIVMENLAHEIRKQKATGRMLANLLDMPETYSAIQRALSDPTYGQRRTKNLSHALMEIVGNPIGFELPRKDKVMALDQGDDEENPDFGDEEDMGDEENFGDDEDMGDEDLSDDDFDDDEENLENDDENLEDDDYNTDDVDDEENYDDEEEGMSEKWPRQRP